MKTMFSNVIMVSIRVRVWTWQMRARPEDTYVVPQLERGKESVA